MAQINLSRQTDLTDFGLEAPYNADIWDICGWDIYKDADEGHKKAWNARSSVMGGNLDFSLCENRTIREELKYFSYHLLEEKKISLRTLAEYSDRYKLLFNFVNSRQYSSVLDIDTVDYERYIIPTHKAVIGNGSALTGQEIVASNKRNRLISFLDSFKKVIYEYMESAKPLYERDIWSGKEIHPDEHNTANLDFRGIEQPLIKQEVKSFLKFRLPDWTTKTAYMYLNDFTLFCQWLYEYNENIASFKDINRDVLEDYFIFLRVDSDFSQNKINKNILCLSALFDYGIVTGNENFPDTVLFLPDDCYFKTQKRANFYTEEEVAAIFSIIKYLPKTYGKILLVLHHTGMRVSEVLRLSIDALKTKDGKPYLAVYMYKTKRYNYVPIDGNIHKLIIDEIRKTHVRFPDAKYIFVNGKGNVIDYSAFTKTVKEVLIKHDVRGRDGELLDFRTHRFRATKATYLINAGYDPRNVADMLGQKSLSSLSYYAVATNQSLQVHMQEYLKKESILINSIGKVDEKVIEDYENAHPLCNGWCCRPNGLGICENINACLTCTMFKPSPEHLTTYRLQLSEVESSLAVAVENGFTRMAEQCRKEKAALEKIIKEMEARL